MKNNAFYSLVKNLLLKAQGLSRAQAIAATVAGVLAVGGVGAGGYIVYSQNHKPAGVEAVADTEADIRTEELESVMSTEMIMAEVVEETEEAEIEVKELTLVGTSMEKDLKIKIQDQNSKLVTGEVFVVEVQSTAKGATVKEYEDKDKDGIIYIEDIKAGDYTVELAEVEGYEIKKGSIKVTVKEELEYEKVDVVAEVKTESEVNVSVEDTAVNNVPVESTLTDTVALLPSEVKTSTVEKSAVDQSNFTAASASSDKNSVVLSKTVTSTGGTETPDTTVPDTTTPDTTVPDTTTPDTTTPSETPTTPSEAPAGDESVFSTEGMSASVERNRVSRSATAATNAVTVTVSLPKSVTLYNVDNAASTSYVLQLGIDGDASLIKSIEWSTTNSEIAAISGTSGTSITVSKGANSGTRTAHVGAVITYYTDEQGNTAQVLVNTAVTVSNLKDTTTVLKDKSGNILYKDQSAQQQAVLSDYHVNTRFYTSPKYTGWHTIGGKVYYYNSNNQPVTGNQVIGGVMYTFNADGSMAQSSGKRGIDVSKWQGNIDWNAVAASGIEFAIIRVGYRGAQTGALIEDPYFRQNIAGATRAGIKVGVYFFTQAINEAEAVEEASMALSLVSGYNLSYPIFIDTENASNGRANGLDVNTRTAVVNAFCRTIANSGHRAGIYASKSWFNSKLNTAALSNYTIWVAQYNSSCTYTGKYNIWQYTSKGSVPGINGNVDMNISYM